MRALRLMSLYVWLSESLQVFLTRLNYRFFNNDMPRMPLLIYVWLKGSTAVDFGMM